MNACDRQILTVLAMAREPLDKWYVAGRAELIPSETMARLDAMYHQGFVHWKAVWPRLWTITPAGRVALAATSEPDRPTRTEWILGLTFLLAMAVIGVMLLVVGE